MHISNCPYLRLTRSIYASSNKSSILSVPCLYIAAFHDVWRVEVVFGWRLGFILSIQTIHTLDVSHSKSLIFIIIVVVVVVFIKFNSLRETSKVHMDIHLYAGWLAGCCIKPSAPLFFSHFDLCETNAQGWTDGRTDKRQTHVCMCICIYSNIFTKCDSFNVVASSRISLSHK